MISKTGFNGDWRCFSKIVSQRRWLCQRGPDVSVLVFIYQDFLTGQRDIHGLHMDSFTTRVGGWSVQIYWEMGLCKRSLPWDLVTMAIPSRWIQYMDDQHLTPSHHNIQWQWQWQGGMVADAAHCWLRQWHQKRLRLDIHSWRMPSPHLQQPPFQLI